jgi:hypothetical protein
MCCGWSLFDIRLKPVAEFFDTARGEGEKGYPVAVYSM